MEEFFLTVNEVSRKTDVTVYTLRYWEKIFSDVLVPLRTKGNQRRYNSEDIKIILKIKKLLKEDLYSTAGAKKIFEKKKKKILIK